MSDPDVTPRDVAVFAAAVAAPTISVGLAWLALSLLARRRKGAVR